MKSNKDNVYAAIRKLSNSSGEILNSFSTQELADNTGISRSNLSTLLNILVKEGKIEKTITRPVKYRLVSSVTKDNNSNFHQLIGYKDSLKNPIQLAKAAIMYPTSCLPTIILAEEGCGTSFFVQQMCDYTKAKKVISVDGAFIKYNCKSFAYKNENEIIDVFDEKANQSSLLERAESGILFINHLEFLSMSMKDRFFDLLDNNVFKDRNIFLICSMNKANLNNEVDLYSAKFPVKIILPSLQEKTLRERMNLIQSILREEATKMSKRIEINSEIYRCLLLYTCHGNIKQLLNDIKIGCANAYAREFDIEDSNLQVYMNDFPNYVRKGFLLYKSRKREMDELIPSIATYIFSKDKMERIQNDEKVNEQSKRSIYDIIDNKMIELKDKGVSDHEIYTIISNEIDDYFVRISKGSEQTVNRESITKIIDKKIVDSLDDFIKEASKRFNRVFSSSSFYELCLHISAMFDRTNKSQIFSNNKIMDVVTKYKEEYEFCASYVTKLEQEFSVRLPIDEIVFITLFIVNNDIQEKSQHPVMLVAMHGDSTATSLVNVVERILNLENIYAYDLSLDKNMDNAYEELKRKFIEIDTGAGILLMYDMGSIKTMSELISQETGILIRMIEIPYTLITIDFSRKLMDVDNLDKIYNTLLNDFKQSFHLLQDSYARLEKKQAIVTLCMSGKGGALYMKQYLEKNVQLENCDIIPLAVSDRNSLVQELNHLMKGRNIVCIIGSYNPNVFGIRYIPISAVLDVPVEKLSVLLLMDDEVDYNDMIDYDIIFDNLEEGLPELDIKRLKKHLPKAISRIKKKVSINSQQEIGLLMHIACSIPRIQNNSNLVLNDQKNSIINKNKRLYNDIKDALTPLEETFDIIFPDDELAYMISSIKYIN